MPYNAYFFTGLPTSYQHTLSRFNLKFGTSNDLQTTQVTELSSCSIKAGVLRDALLRASSANAAVKTTGGCLSGIRRGVL